MNIEAYRQYCLSKKGVVEELPFDDYILAHKVMGKIFALTHVDTFESINLKCDPEKAIQLREAYEGVVPGYHMNKKHWNTVKNNSDIPDKLLYDWIDDSYRLVVSTLPKAIQGQLKNYTTES